MALDPGSDLLLVNHGDVLHGFQVGYEFTGQVTIQRREFGLASRRGMHQDDNLLALELGTGRGDRGAIGLKEVKRGARVAPHQSDRGADQ